MEEDYKISLLELTKTGTIMHGVEESIKTIFSYQTAVSYIERTSFIALRWIPKYEK